MRQIRTAIDKLKSTNEITIDTTNRYSLVTIVNWNEYQSDDDISTNKSTKSLTNKQPTDNQQITNKQPQRKNDKKNKECKEDKESDQLLPPWAAEKGWTPEYYEEWNDQ